MEYMELIKLFHVSTNCLEFYNSLKTIKSSWTKFYFQKQPKLHIVNILEWSKSIFINSRASLRWNCHTTNVWIEGQPHFKGYMMLFCGDLTDNREHHKNRPEICAIFMNIQMYICMYVCVWRRRGKKFIYP